jgi:hypothetical protein
VTVRRHSRLARLLAVGVMTGLWMAVLPNAGISVSSTDAGGTTARPVSMVRPLRSPTGVIATATDAQAVVRWSMPAAESGPVISTYVVTSVPPGLTAAVSSTQQSAVVNGLTNGTAYSFEVAASNSAGAGPESMPSNVVRPSRLVSVASSVSLKSVNAMFNGGMCLYGGVECFGIQQNLFIQGATAQYWLQNIVFVEESARHGWRAQGAYEIWNGTQQSLLACSGQVASGPFGPDCVWTGAWRSLKFPAHIELASSVERGRVVLHNSLGGSFAPWAPSMDGVDDIVNPLSDAVASASSLLAPELVVVGEDGRHNVSFNGGSGDMSTLMTLANGRVLRPGTTCVTESGGTSTGEQSVGLYWNVGTSQLVDFAAHGGTQGDGDGVSMLPTLQSCR